MRFNLKYLLALVVVPSALAYIEEPCLLGEGVCLPKSKCVMSAGQKGSARTIPLLCLHDPSDVVCCIKTVTQLTDGTKLTNTGVCKNVSECPVNKNDIYSNQCPGGNDVKLCVPNKKKTITSTTTTTTTEKATITTIIATTTTATTTTSTTEEQPTDIPFTQKEIIDISQWNEVTNYDAIVPAIDGVLIRCGYRGYGSEGNFAKDTKFEQHYLGFNGKTKIGYYFFTQAVNTKEAEDEADYVVNTLLKDKTNDFPIFWDSEYSGASFYSGRADLISKKTRTACAVAFIKKIQDYGYRAGIYASEKWFKNNLNYDELTEAGAYIWVAKYNTKTPSTSYYDAWQYTSSGRIDGIDGNVDQSHVYNNIANW